VTIGAALGLTALGLAFGAAAIRSRSPFWALTSLALFGAVGYRIVRFGLDSTQLVTNLDRLLGLIGLLLLAALVTVTMGLPKSIEHRLIYGSGFRIASFERALWEARRPFVEAAANWDASMEEKSHWRATLGVDPPSDAWASLADRVAAADEVWAAQASTGDGLVRSDLVTTDLISEWEALRERYLGDVAMRGRRLSRLGGIGYVVSVSLLLAGSFNVTNGLFSGPPSGRAASVPATPTGRTVLFAPLGAFPAADLQDLAAFYAERYDLQVEILSPAAIPRAARDVARDQLVAEALIEGIRAAYSEARDPSRVVIGVTNQGLHIRGRPDWDWAFGMATEGHLAVLSTARMGPEPGPFGHQLETARLRKMITKYIGILYFDLPLSSDPRSVLYRNILGVPDLDAMGEDY
jgi:hypothetical protein